MQRFNLLQIFLIATKILTTTTAAAAKTNTDCKRLPEGLQNVASCCNLPMPNWSAYNSECSTSGTQPSCRLACIFNSSKALNADHQLNLTRMRPILERVFNDQQLIEAYQRGFSDCAPLIRSKYGDLTKLSKQSDACERYALFYSLCAYFRLMKNCPKNAWNSNNKNCGNTRIYNEKCPWTALRNFMKNT